MKDILILNNLKVTKQRIDILNTIEKLDFNASIKNIVNNLSNLDKSTIYRTLNIFEKKNIVTKMIGYNDEVIYVIEKKHMHYIKCLKCNKIQVINDCPLKNNIVTDNFKIIGHKLAFLGICKDCSK